MYLIARKFGLFKDATPIGTSNSIAIEVKVGAARAKHLDQLGDYVDALGAECEGGVLIVRSASPRVLASAATRGLHVFEYASDSLQQEGVVPFHEMLGGFRLTRL